MKGKSNNTITISAIPGSGFSYPSPAPNCLNTPRAGRDGAIKMEGKMINPSKYYLILQDSNGDIFRGISHGRNIGDKFDFNQKPVEVLFVGNKKESVQHFKQLKGRVK